MKHVDRRSLIKPILAIIPVDNKLVQTADENLRCITLHQKEVVESTMNSRGVPQIDELRYMFECMLRVEHPEDVEYERTLDEVFTILYTDHPGIQYTKRQKVDVDIMRCSPTAFRISIMRDLLKHKKMAFNPGDMSDLWIQFCETDGYAVYDCM